MSSFTLKIIALATMIFDHIGAVFFPQYLWIRIVGRISFPIYAFLVAQGYIHTKNKFKYALRLGAFALVSEIPYDLLFYGKFLEFNYQNIMFELLLGLFAIWCLDLSIHKKQYYMLIPMLVLVFASEYLCFSYGIYGIVLMLMAYLGSKNNIISGVASGITTYIFNGIKAVWVSFLGRTITIISFNTIQVYAIFSAIPIMLYNGKKGKFSLKWFFYIIYPTHLLVLYIIKLLILKA